MAQPPFARLGAVINRTQTQLKNNPLFQVLKQLAQYTEQSAEDLVSRVTTLEESTGGGSGTSGLVNGRYLTWDDQTAQLPFSRELIAEDTITFDDSTPGERTVSMTIHPLFFTRY